MKSNGKWEKWVEEFYLKYSTATSRAKRKLQKIRERNTKKELRWPKTAEKGQDPKKEKKETQEKLRKKKDWKCKREEDQSNREEEKKERETQRVKNSEKQSDKVKRLQ